MEELTVDANGARLHLRRAGSGPPLLLLHGWPEFSLAWEPVMERLRDRWTLLAPDLRGFGDSSKPAGPYGPDGHAADMLALLAALGVERCGVVAHDAGGPVAVQLARDAPARLAGLMLFSFVYPGIGERMGAPDRLSEIWYQFFNQTEIAPAIVGASRESCRAYIGHFLRHWAHRADAHDDVLERYVDNFLKPGNLAGGFAHYRASNEPRLAVMRGEVPDLPPVAVPTAVRWPAHDRILPASWADRLDEFFSDVDVALFPGVGHFPHREDPDGAAGRIDDFFSRLPPFAPA